MNLDQRVSRLTRAYGLHDGVENDEAALLQRVEALLEVIPTPAIRMLLASCGAAHGGDRGGVDEYRVVREHFAVLLVTGVWPVCERDTRNELEGLS